MLSHAQDDWNLFDLLGVEIIVVILLLYCELKLSRADEEFAPEISNISQAVETLMLNGNDWYKMRWTNLNIATRLHLTLEVLMADHGNYWVRFAKVMESLASFICTKMEKIWWVDYSEVATALRWSSALWQKFQLQDERMLDLASDQS